MREKGKKTQPCDLSWSRQYLDGVTWFFDVGVGPPGYDEAGWYLDEFPDWKFLGFEANVEYYRQRVKTFPGTMLHMGVGDREENRVFYLEGGNSSYQIPAGVGRREVITVKMVTLDWAWNYADRPEGVYLWMDIEGGEMNALLGAKEMLSAVRAINLEISDAPRFHDQPTRGELDGFLWEAGFRAIREHSHAARSYDLFYIRRDQKIIRERFRYATRRTGQRGQSRRPLDSSMIR